MEHPFWGIIKKTSTDCEAGISFSHAFFGSKPTEILLQADAAGNIPDEEALFGYASTYVHFINNIGTRLLALQEAMFEVYKKYLAENFESPVQTIEEHNEYIKDLAFIRIGPDDGVEFCFYYSLINTPVHSVTFVGDKVYACYDEP